MKPSLTGLIALCVVILVMVSIISLGGKKRVYDGFQGAMGETNDRGTFTMYYADWCPHCQTAKPMFQEFAKNGYISVNDKRVKCQMKEEKQIQKGVDPDVKGYPSFLYSDASGKIVEYNGPRNASGFMEFLKQILA